MSTNGSNKAIITCAACGQRFSVTPPTPEQPINTLRATVGLAPHEKPIRCPNSKCGKRAVWVAKEIQFIWDILPITDEQAASIEESRIIPFSGLAIN